MGEKSKGVEESSRVTLEHHQNILPYGYSMAQHSQKHVPREASWTGSEYSQSPSRSTSTTTSTSISTSTTTTTCWILGKHPDITRALKVGGAGTLALVIKTFFANKLLDLYDTENGYPQHGLTSLRGSGERGGGGRILAHPRDCSSHGSSAGLTG